jgi:hypothetical protein
MVEGGDHQERGRPLLGYAVSVGIVLAAVVALAVLLAGAFGEDGNTVDVSADVGPDKPAQPPAEVLPDGGVFPTPTDGMTLEAAVKAAGCELKSFPVKSRDHIKDLQAPVRYSSLPPTSGPHYAVPAADGAYEHAPYLKTIVHSLEHSRIVVWFKPDLPSQARGALKAFFDADSALMLLVPFEPDMDYEVAASAWNRKPKPNGTGRLLGCPEYNDAVFTALEQFKQRHRGKGPEQIP